MAQLQCMDALLGRLHIELYQVNTRIGRIARQQACLGGFVTTPTPSPAASEDEDNSGTSGDTFYVDEASSSSIDDEMTTSQ